MSASDNNMTGSDSRPHHADENALLDTTPPEHRETTWPRELWWCENPKCDEPTCEDPCQFCGDPVARYTVIPLAESERREQAAWERGMREGFSK